MRLVAKMPVRRGLSDGSYGLTDHCAAALLSDPSKCIVLYYINELGDLTPNLAKVEVASSSLVSRSMIFRTSTMV